MHKILQNIIIQSYYNTKNIPFEIRIELSKVKSSVRIIWNTSKSLHMEGNNAGHNIAGMQNHYKNKLVQV